MGAVCFRDGGDGSDEEVLALGDISLEYSEQRLHEATQDFHPSRMLGKGQFGAVYHGSLPEGTEVAVKVIMTEGGDVAEGGFAHEIRVLSKFRHPNLVTLMGWGQQGNRHFLIYEFLEGGDVHARLSRCRAEGLPFTCAQRLWVARDAACGLAHMMNSTPRAFHRDIKTANILLTKSGEAKMGDFGLSGIVKATGGDDKGFDSASICGTPGYCCPHYLRTGRVSEQSEAYAFGMAALALLLNEMPASVLPGGEMVFPIFRIVKPMYSGSLERAMAAIDPNARWPPELARSLAEDVALPCSAYELSSRPTFLAVAGRLRALVDRFCGGQRSELLSQWEASQPPPPPKEVAPSTEAWQDGTMAVLECVAANGVDIKGVPYWDKCISLAAGEGPWTLGPKFQPDIFARLVPSQELRDHISKSPFQLSKTHPSGSAGKDGPQLSLTRLTPGQVLVDHQEAESQQQVWVSTGTRIGFCGTDDTTQLLVFEIHLRSMPKAPVSSALAAMPSILETTEGPENAALPCLCADTCPQEDGPQPPLTQQSQQESAALVPMEVEPAEEALEGPEPAEPAASLEEEVSQEPASALLALEDEAAREPPPGPAPTEPTSPSDGAPAAGALAQETSVVQPVTLMREDGSLSARTQPEASIPTVVQLSTSRSLPEMAGPADAWLDPMLAHSERSGEPPLEQRHPWASRRRGQGHALRKADMKRTNSAPSPDTLEAHAERASSAPSPDTLVRSPRSMLNAREAHSSGTPSPLCTLEVAATDAELSCYTAAPESAEGLLAGSLPHDLAESEGPAPAVAQPAAPLAPATAAKVAPSSGAALFVIRPASAVSTAPGSLPLQRRRIASLWEDAISSGRQPLSEGAATPTSALSRRVRTNAPTSLSLRSSSKGSLQAERRLRAESSEMGA